MRYWIKTHWLVRKLFPSFVWNIPSSDTVYLTFDDGPTPDVTPWVLDQLEAHNAKATFFCIGDCISKRPELFRRLIDGGHSIGNHTFHHLDGWKTPHDQYMDDVEQCQQKIKEFVPAGTRLLRPPYGKLKHSQVKKLRAMGYKIIMWDVLSADFDTALSPEQCTANVIKNIEPGSVVIFHDSVKAWPRLKEALPATLQRIKEKGWKCEPIRFAPEPGR